MDAAWIGDFSDDEEHNVHVVLSKNASTNIWSLAEKIGEASTNVYDIPSEQISPNPENPTHITIPNGTDLTYSYDLTYNA